MDIKGFYHICFINNWQTVVDEQIKKIVSSGLYDKSSAIYIGCCGGSIIDKHSLTLMITPFSKFNIIYFNKNRLVYEIPTLQYMQDTCNTLKFEQDFLLWYIHTKGMVSGNHARRYDLEESVITQHDKCIKILEKNKNIACCGPSLRHWTGSISVTGYNPPYNGWHFSGNFWWTKASYIITIKENLSGIFAAQNNRYVAEAFIGRISNSPSQMGDLTNYDYLGVNKTTKSETRKNLLTKLWNYL